MSEAASAYVTLIPSAKGFARKATSELTEPVGSAGRSMSSKLGGILKTGALGVGVAAGGVLAGALVKGFGRLTAIENATAKLKGLGHSAGDVKKIMNNALASVKGTAFGLGDAATVAAGTVAAGIKPGKQLTKTLTLVADAATIGGSSLSSMGSIFNKVASSNKLQGDTINQLNDQGIPILQFLGKTLHKNQGEVSKLASKGKIDFKTFSKALTEGVGGAAKKSGDTTKGAFANVQAALGRFGATLLTGIFPLFKVVFGGLIKLLDGLNDTVGPLAAQLSGVLGAAFGYIVAAIQPAIQWIKDFVASFTSGGGLAATKTILSSLSNTFTTVLIPALQSVWSYFTKNILPILVQIVTVIKDDFLPIIEKIAVFFITKVVPALLSMYKTVAEKLQPVLSAFIGVVKSDMIPTLVLIANKFNEWWPTIKTVIMYIVKIISFLAKLAATILGTILPPLIKFVGYLIVNVVKAIIMVIEIIAKVIATLIGFGEGVIDVSKTVYRIFVHTIPDAVKALIDYVVSHIGQIASFFSETFHKVYTAVKTKISDVISVVKGLPAAIFALGGKMLSAGANLMTNLFQGIKNVLTGLGGFAADIGKTILNSIISAINSGLGLPIHLPRINTHIPGVGTIGGQTILPAIPHLAKGGLVQGEGIYRLGDNPSGQELALPLDSPKTAKLLARSIAGTGIGGGGSTTIIVELDGRQIARAVGPAMAKEIRVRGVGR